ncbi:hypothetical protein [Streptomyces sp. x-80]|uniref:hypothetical protein n=1 Tax=Streptomyces sp. x-80 TaxID=2789282 RepID=UPI00397FF83F
MHISLLIHHAHGVGETLRTARTPARTGAARHGAGTVPVRRHRAAPVPGPRRLPDLRESGPAHGGAAPSPGRGRGGDPWRARGALWSGAYATEDAAGAAVRGVRTV